MEPLASVSKWTLTRQPLLLAFLLASNRAFPISSSLANLSTYQKGRGTTSHDYQTLCASHGSPAFTEPLYSKGHVAIKRSQLLLLPAYLGCAWRSESKVVGRLPLVQVHVIPDEGLETRHVCTSHRNLEPHLRQFLQGGGLEADSSEQPGDNSIRMLLGLSTSSRTPCI
jgi:hypothetical protein